MRKCEHLSDLHLHKGGDSLEQIVRTAKKSGRKIISVVDKENIDHILQIEESCKRHDLFCVRGVEVNAHYQNRTHHFFVYNFRRQKFLKRLFKREAKIKFERAIKVAKKLEKLGWIIDWPLLKISTNILGRSLVVDNIINNPINEDRLLKEDIFKRDDFYRAYLNPGRPAYFVRKVMSASLLIKTAHKAGGLVVWAHPVRTIKENFGKFRLNGEFTDMFIAFKNAGIDGIEVYYPGVTDEQIRFLYNLCHKHGLFVTAGSDSVGGKMNEIPRIVDNFVPDDIRQKGSFYRGMS